MKKYFLYVICAIFIVSVLSVFCIAWFHPKPLFFLPTDVPTQSNLAERSVAVAKSMLYTPYDPFMGGLHNALGCSGFVVCIDVPVRAYVNAGVPITEILKDSTKKHPEWFQISPQNRPDNEFFYRRVRNYYPLFKNHPDLEASDKPQPGDWAFFGNFHIALVSSIMPDGTYQVVEANPNWLYVRISDQKYMDKTWGRAAFFGRVKNLKALLK